MVRVKELTKKDVLNAAADWLESHQWIQGDATRTHEGRLVGACMVGAIANVSLSGLLPVTLRWPARDWLNRWLVQVGETEEPAEGALCAAAIVNDREGMTKDYVLRLLRKAAEEAP